MEQMIAFEGEITYNHGSESTKIRVQTESAGNASAALTHNRLVIGGLAS
jgi:hypothetical protein